jgi:hypothetical protein
VSAGVESAGAPQLALVAPAAIAAVYIHIGHIYIYMSTAVQSIQLLAWLLPVTDMYIAALCGSSVYNSSATFPHIPIFNPSSKTYHKNINIPEILS